MPPTSGWRFHAWSGSAASGLDDYSEATLSLSGSDARIVGKHYEYDSVSATQTKRYYANGALVATRSIPNANPGAQTLRYV